MRTHLHAIAVMVTFVGLASSAEAQVAAAERRTGPVIERFGAVFDVPNPDLTADPSMIYKVVFEIGESADQKDAINPAIETLARFLNMQARAGVPVKNLQLAMVVHASATKDLIDHAGYRRRYGVENPNLDLIVALQGAGVRVYVCGQSMASRGVARAELAPNVGVALSALTAMLQLEAEGYRLLQ
jgi:intracellular sulfur oxidation DsrE/DsrF family protein